VTVRTEVNDSEGRTVVLTEERWGHIVERHPEIRTLDLTVMQAVQVPDYRVAGRLANEEWCYVKTDAPSNWLKVVVAYAGDVGRS
jgi:hypothetical protein